MTAAPAVRAYIGLGANLGAAAATLRAAIEALGRLPQSTLAGVSSFYATAPVDATGPDYCNAVAALDTTLGAVDVLAHLQGIEAAHGRERSYRNAPRTLDLDLLLYGEQVLDLPGLTVPHPRMHQRAFVLAPLAEIAPAAMIPGHGRARELLPAVSSQTIRRLP
jgi:2-amino-4-hydroxy-6-hydroxymethyldihydropteridine diphosphokinase